MFKKVRDYFAEFSQDRPGMSDVDVQIECGERLRDMLSVARKLDLPVVITVDVQGVRQGVIDVGDGKLPEFLYNFACGRLLELQTKRDGAIKAALRGGKGVGPVKKGVSKTGPFGP